MTEMHPSQPQPDHNPPLSDPTLDLDMDEFEAVDDLQVLADEVAESQEESEEQQELALGKARKLVQELEAGHKDQAEKYHRLMADFSNYRNRAGRDIQMAVTLAERKLLLEFLPVLDSFERCLGSNYSSLEDFQNGIALIHKQFNESLRKAGVEGVPLKVGDPFDAQHAEALTTTHQDQLPDGAVAAIYERGFMLRDQLLRPARVIVNHNEPATEANGNVNPS
jgi:molecular chaperone GrpE